MARRKQPPSPGLSDEVLEAVSERFRVLGSLSRLKVLNALMQGPRTLGELGEDTGLEQSNLSRHVAELERAGCVARTRDGRNVSVEIVDPHLEELCHVVCGALQEQAEETHRALQGF